VIFFLELDVPGKVRLCRTCRNPNKFNSFVHR
jgi:hypothetical protein